MLAHIERLRLWFFFFNVVFTISPLVLFFFSLSIQIIVICLFFFPKALLITGLSSHMCHIQIKYRCSFTVGNNHFRDGKQTRILITRKKGPFSLSFTTMNDIQTMYTNIDLSNALALLLLVKNNLYVCSTYLYKSAL